MLQCKLGGKKIIILFLILLTSIDSLNFVLPKLTKAPKIDSILKREEYKESKMLTGFTESQPVEGEEPPFSTKVYLGYDENNLYVAFKNYDDINTVKKTLTNRDEYTGDDIVAIYLDTYGELKEGYIFATNPLSVQFDGTKGPPPQNMEDFTFDTNWEVKSYIGEDFWSCEFKIPFSSLRFEIKERQEWRIIFLRIRPRESLETYSWPALSSNNPSFFRQGGTLIIPEKIHSEEKKLAMIPYLLGSQNGIRKEKYEFDKGKFDFGLSGKYRLLQNFILDFALNPDYSQIETDLPQIDVNTTFCLYYPEKRPFFMEGMRDLETAIEAIYTRTISNPLFALKGNGRASIFRILFLSAYDENSIYILPFEDYSFKFPSDKRSYINILRIKSDFLNKESHIGFLMGDREVKKDSFDNGFNRILGLDTRIRFLKNYTLSYQGIYSNTKEPEDSLLFYGFGLKFKDYTDRFDGENFPGFSQYAKFNLSFRNLWSSVYYKDYSPTFRSDLGFIDKNNFKTMGFELSPRIYPNKYVFSELSLFLNFEKEKNYEDVFKREWISCGINSKFSFAQTQIELSLDKMDKNLFNLNTGDYSRFKDLESFDFTMTTIPKKWLPISIGGNIGDAIYYQEYLPAYKVYLRGNFGILLTKFALSSGVQGYYLYREKYKNTICDVLTFQNSISYQFTQNLSLQFRWNYYAQTKDLEIYPLISYELTPFILFYLGANINTAKHDGAFGIQGQRHQIFAKFQYWFRI